jgi:hypothetical protein
MNLDPFQKNDFENRLAYFGGAITANYSNIKQLYQDLECFFVDATLMMGYDVRVTQTFINWLSRYGIILCPSKIKQILITTNYDHAILGVFVTYLMQHDSRPKRWELLTSFTKKSNAILFAHLPVPKLKNNYFEKFGIAAPLMTLNENKYLLPKDAVLKNCIELKYRSMMMGAVASDVHSLLEKDGYSKSSYEIAKITRHHKAQVYSLIKTMRQLGTIEEPIIAGLKS